MTRSLLALLLAGCLRTTSEPPATVRAEPEPSPELVAGPRCGAERWDVKVGTDPLATSVQAEPVDATIAEIVALPRPAGSARADSERRVYRLHATVTGYKLEADRDYHLVLADDAGRTMIVEVPDPACMGRSPWREAVASARSAFEAMVPAASARLRPVSVRVVVEGVAFFDKLHGQSGVAPNGVELHPVVRIERE